MRSLARRDSRTTGKKTMMHVSGGPPNLYLASPIGGQANMQSATTFGHASVISLTSSGLRQQSPRLIRRHYLHRTTQLAFPAAQYVKPSSSLKGVVASTMAAAKTSLFSSLSMVTALLAGIVYYLVNHPVPWEKEYFYEMERNMTRLPQQDDITEPDYTRTTVYFMSEGEKLEGWLYEPVPQNPVTPPPCVIMSHGLGSQKDMGLHPYAEQMAQGGLAVLLFDYRGFGGSDGAIRHWVSWRRHLQDVQAAIDFVYEGGLGRGRVDTSRIALWGVSYSGGHMLMMASNAANHDKIKAVVAKEPYLTGQGKIKEAMTQRGAGQVVRLLLAAVLDKAREALGLGPIYIKLIGGHHELAILNVSPEELSFSRGGLPAPPPRIGGWRGIATARMLVDNLWYKPIQHVQNIRCPVLLIAGTKDAITPIQHVRAAQQLLGDKATLVEKPYGHIEMHRKMMEAQELAPMIDFLRQKLGLKPTHVTTQPHEAHPEDTAAEVL